MTASVLVQLHYQFQDDGADANTSALIGSEDTANTALLLDTTYFIRVKLQETGGMDANNINWQLEYNVAGAGYNDVTTTSSNVRSVTGGDDDGDAMTERLSTTGQTYTNGLYETSGITPNFTAQASLDFEHVYPITFRSAELTAGNEEIDLKITNSGTDLTSYAVTIEATMPDPPADVLHSQVMM